MSSRHGLHLEALGIVSSHMRPTHPRTTVLSRSMSSAQKPTFSSTSSDIYATDLGFEQAFLLILYIFRTFLVNTSISRCICSLNLLPCLSLSFIMIKYLLFNISVRISRPMSVLWLRSILGSFPGTFVISTIVIVRSTVGFLLFPESFLLM